MKGNGIVLIGRDQKNLTSHLLMVLPCSLVTLGIRFSTNSNVNLGGHIQTIASSEPYERGVDALGKSGSCWCKERGQWSVEAVQAVCFSPAL